MQEKGCSLGKENDSRITKVGNILRKLRIDEIPQFWNVIKEICLSMDQDPSVLSFRKNY